MSLAHDPSLARELKARHLMRRWGLCVAPARATPPTPSGFRRVRERDTSRSPDAPRRDASEKAKIMLTGVTRQSLLDCNASKRTSDVSTSRPCTR